MVWHGSNIAHILVCHSVDPSRMLNSIPEGRRNAPWYIFFHGDNLTIEKNTIELMRRHNADFFNYRQNRGLSVSWNDAIHLAYDRGCSSFLLLNDDVVFNDGGYEKFVSVVEEHSSNPEIGFITTKGLDAGSSEFGGQVVTQGFACGAITRATIDKIGYFDENFVPAYYEDIDYSHRMWLAGLRAHDHDESLLVHERSSTRHTMDEEKQQALYRLININKEYIERKWGPTPQYHTPFQAEFGAKIDFVDRKNPYGKGFDVER